MQFKEFGTNNTDTLVLIHGLGITWRMFTPIIDKLQNSYHLVVPVLYGHNEEDDSVFETIEDQVDKIINYLKSSFGREIFGIYGFSLGGTIAMCILEKNEVSFKNAIIDGGPTYPKSEWFIKFSIKVTISQINSLKGTDSMFKKLFKKSFYPADMINEACSFAQYAQLATIKNAMDSAFHYKLETLNYGGRLAYWYGSRESYLCKKYAKHIKTIYPDTIVKAFKKYRHGQLAIENPQKCIDAIDEFLSNSLD